ncbi:DUF4372 domain-containing protein [bacterium]|nr:DUF4372 domain-containing protein [bacterium]
MNSGHTIFAQLMDIIPQHRFRQHVQRYRAEKGVRKLFCKAQFQALAFTQLTGRDSLRSIEIGLNSFGNGLYHMGFRSPKSRKFWNRIPDVIKEKVVDIALDYPDKSPRQLAWHITDSERYFISESSVFRILKSYDLITSPAFIVMSAKDKFQHPAKYINEFWQTDSPISRSSAGAGTFCPRAGRLFPVYHHLSRRDGYARSCFRPCRWMM